MLITIAPMMLVSKNSLDTWISLPAHMQKPHLKPQALENVGPFGSTRTSFVSNCLQHHTEQKFTLIVGYILSTMTLLTCTALAHLPNISNIHL